MIRCLEGNFLVPNCHYHTTSAFPSKLLLLPPQFIILLLFGYLLHIRLAAAVESANERSTWQKVIVR